MLGEWLITPIGLEIIEKRGKIAEVHKIQSLRPESIVKHMYLYLEIIFSKSELSRAEREMMAVVVSVNNDCEYCQLHHGEALNHYWKEKEKISLLKNNYILKIHKNSQKILEMIKKVKKFIFYNETRMQ